MSLRKVSILLPCLNESETLEKCIKSIKKSMKNTKYNWEIIVCDNNSVDDSIKIAKKNNVSFFIEENKGYGNTLINGINKSKSEFLVMLDADMSYDSEDIPKMLEFLENGYDLVIGNRFKGKTSNDAFPLFHKSGSKCLNFVANLLFNTKVKDFHCGLRAFKRSEILKLGLKSSGMEFASEMIIKAKIHKLKIKEMNTNYKKDERTGKSHLRTVRDGFRHLSLVLKLKWDSSSLIKYMFLFIGVLAVLISVLLATISVKNSKVDTNIIKSLEQYSDNNYDGFLFGVSKTHFEYYIDYPTEIKNLSLVYLIDESNPIKSMIEMNYYNDSDNGVANYSLMFKEHTGNKMNYSRYWHGQIIYLKTLLSFFTMDKIYIINAVILFVLFIILLIKLYIVNKKLFISSLVSFVMVNIFVIPFSTEFYFSFLITLIGSIFVINCYEKQRKVDYLFLVLGMVTCFFDFLTTETLSLTVPLFIHIYLNKDKIEIKEILKYIFIWGMSYALMFFIKWGISYIYYGSEYLNELNSFASVRIINTNQNYFNTMFAMLVKILMYIFPFNLTPFALVLSTIFLLIVVYIFVFEIKNKEKYVQLLIVSSVPIIRFLLLSGHSSFHVYFTYRAIVPILMFCILVLLDIKKMKKIYKTCYNKKRVG